ncbi:hypothetical protein D1P53_004940 [Cryptococcus gattii VGV]|nr:hypothetical protein D1P53_004940 [Cryptococcus gattii VGV]
MRILSWLPLLVLPLPLAALPPSTPADPWALFRYAHCPVNSPSPSPPAIVSFEEWKRIQIAPANNSSPPPPVSPSDSPSPAPPPHTPPPATDNKPAPPPPQHSKYNYASPDCSARIHSSSPLTQHAASLLHKSRDRYMLTPCRAAEHWVVVELCDEIRIDAIEIAVWEFFSGVVREVQVSVGGEDGDGEDEVAGRGHLWKQVGSFIGKNVRGSQTFTLSQPTSFHRFIRLDFPSYYGSEYYCPVSSLKVYGMNQMEAFKWEQKQLNHNREKEMFREEEEVRRAKETQEREKKERDRDERDKQQQREKELDELEKLLHEQAGRLVPELLTDGFEEAALATPTTPASTTPVASTTPASTNAPTEPTLISKREDEKPDDVPPPANESLATSTATSISEPSTTPVYTRPRSDSSESIYAFIIRRLNALEGNSSLVARYMEEQAKVMRSMLKRVEVGWDEWKGEWEDEDRGRWQQERMRQEDRLGRVLSQLEQQRIAFDAERKSIETQLRVLADQLGYERRRGIAQLIIMVIIILLGAASRSSTINAILTPLVTEARRRQSDYYHRKNRSGPLAGLHIDMGAGRPPAVIGQARPGSSPSAHTHTHTHTHTQTQTHTQTPTPTHRRVPSTSTPRLKTSLSRTGSAHTSLKRRGIVPQLSIPIPVPSYYRSVSSSEFTSPPPTDPAAAASAASASLGLVNVWTPRTRVSLPLSPPPPPPASGSGASAARKAARSAHLHMMETGDRPHENSDSGSGSANDHIAIAGSREWGMNTKRRRRLRSVLNSDLTRKDEGERGEKAGAGDTSQGEWGTDFDDTETSSAAASASGSASEVEDQVRDDTDTKEEMDGDTEQRVREKM